VEVLREGPFSELVPGFWENCARLDRRERIVGHEQFVLDYSEAAYRLEAGGVDEARTGLRLLYDAAPDADNRQWLVWTYARRLVGMDVAFDAWLRDEGVSVPAVGDALRQLEAEGAPDLLRKFKPPAEPRPRRRKR